MNRYTPSKADLVKLTTHHNFLAGHYVYIYLDNGRPFYVGMGTERRAFKPHSAEVDARCYASSNFSIEIYSHFHTKRSAHHIERVLTAQLAHYGLLNKRIANVDFRT